MNSFNLVSFPRTARPECLAAWLETILLKNPLPKSRFSGFWVIRSSTNASGNRQIPLPDTVSVLLDVDLRAGVFKLLLDVFSFALGDAFLDSLRSSFDQILGFLQAETGDSADFLDDVDLVGAGFGRITSNSVFLFSGFSRSSSTASSSNGHRCSGGNAPLFFKHLGQLSSFQDGQVGKVFHDFGEISHFSLPCIRFEPVLNYFTAKFRLMRLRPSGHTRR
jgi:hypothetical protein